MEALPESEIRWISLTGVLFADPAGRVFEYRGGIYRAIRAVKAGFIRGLFDLGVVDALVREKLLVPTRLTSLSLPGYEFIVQHDRVPAPLRPAFWPFAFLQSAAETFLRLNLARRKTASINFAGVTCIFSCYARGIRNWTPC